MPNWPLGHYYNSPLRRSPPNCLRRCPPPFFLRKNPCLRSSEIRSSSGLESSPKTRRFARAIARMPQFAESDRDGTAIRQEQSWWNCNLPRAIALRPRFAKRRLRWKPQFADSDCDGYRDSQKGDCDECRESHDVTAMIPHIATAIATIPGACEKRPRQTCRIAKSDRNAYCELAKSDRDEAISCKRGFDDTGQPRRQQPVKKSRALT